MIFNDQTAIQLLLHQAADQNAAADERQRAIQALVAKRVNGFDELLLELMRDETTRRAALRGLAEYNHPETVATILDVYPGLDLAMRQEALQTLAVRPAWARALLDSIELNQIPRSDLTAFTARQIHNLGDKQLSAKVEKLWGQIRETPNERARLIAAIEIEQRVVSKVSMMAEGLLQRLTPDEVRDLFAYLTGPDQVSFPADANSVPVEKPM